MRLNTYEDSELDVLEEYLSSDDAPEHCMTLSELDGFLAGLVAGPEAIDEREWMPLVWGGEVPFFHDSDHSADVLRAIFHRRRVIEEELRDEDGTYLPILWETEDGVRIAEDWAQGFASAIELRLDAWDALIRHKKFGFLILPIAGLLRDENGLPLLPQEDIDEVDPEDLMELISPSVAGSYAFWRMREAGYGEAPPRKAPKIGRNDPCPCGSGKKYKKCCG